MTVVKRKMHSVDMMANETLALEATPVFSNNDGSPQNSSERVSPYALYAAVSLMSVTIFIGTIGNIMVILAVRTHKKLQTASNAFVVNLSVCDLVFVMIILPFNIYTYLKDTWDLSVLLCKLIGFLGYTLTGTTIITITMIAFNRYKLVVDSQNYPGVFSRRNLSIMLMVSWVLPALCLIPAVLEKWGRFGYVTMMVTCNLLLDHDSQSFKLFLLIVRAVIPCFLILYYYIHIYRTTKASHRRVMSRSLLVPTFSRMDQMIQRKEMHLTKMMATIFIVFALSYFPCTISSIVDWNTVLSKRFHMFCLITVYVGSAVNPLIYGLMNSQFRSAYYSIMLCRCFSTCDDTLPSPRPSSLSKKRSRRSKQKQSNKAKCNEITEKPPICQNPSPMVSMHTQFYSHASTETSDDHNCSPPMKHPGSKVHMYRELSTDSDYSNRVSNSFQENGHFDQSLHRTDTERTCLGDYGFENNFGQHPSVE